jgi:arabinogalactan endo-1,4-beta-galactosidase
MDIKSIWISISRTSDLAKWESEKSVRDIKVLIRGRDSWADPNKQPPPTAWPTTLHPLASTLRSYVKDTLVAFKKAGVVLDLVALGNEIRHGILWPVGYADVDVEPWQETVRNFSSLATLWKAARAGVDDAVWEGVTKPLVMIHIDNGWNLTLQQRWFGAMVENGISTSAWDVSILICGVLVPK